MFTIFIPVTVVLLANDKFTNKKKEEDSPHSVDHCILDVKDVFNKLKEFSNWVVNIVFQKDEGRTMYLPNALNIFSLQDWRWRDVGRTETCSEKYSDEQIKYFETPPGKRFEVIESLIANMNL